MQANFAADFDKPLLNRGTAVALAGCALSLLAFPGTCSAQPAAAVATADDCRPVQSVELVGAAAETFLVVHRRCDDGDDVAICDGRSCRPDPCAPAGFAHPTGRAESADGWVEATLPMPRKGGAQDVLVVRRVGNGGYPQIAHYFVEGGQPVCHNAVGLEGLLGSAAAALGDQESFGFRGGLIDVFGGRLILTKGIYRPEDPNCCPSGGFLRIFARPRGANFAFERAERLAALTPRRVTSLMEN